MKLGVDVDGVVLDTLPLYEKAFAKLGFPLKAGKAHLWALAERHAANTKIINKVLSKIAAIINVSLVPGAQILNKIVNLPCIESPIHFISSRDFGSQHTTWKALKRHFNFPFQLWCGGSKTNKGIACDLFDLDFFIEDGPPHIENIYHESYTRIYILDKPYNKDVYTPGDVSVLRVKNWDEILIDIQREGYREAVRVSEPPHNL